MEIGNGAEASLQYFYSIHKYDNQEDISRIRNALEKYCELDTMAMVDIVTELNKIVKK